MHGVKYFFSLSKQFVLVTSNRQHPAFDICEGNLHILFQNKLNLSDMLEQLKRDFGCNGITVQTGGTHNELFLRDKLFDYIDIVVAPVLIGGKDTTTLIDGNSLTSPAQLSQLGVLELQKCQPLKHSYIRLRYKVAA